MQPGGPPLPGPLGWSPWTAPPAVPPSVPSGPPTDGLLITGAVGQFLGAGVSVPLVLFSGPLGGFSFGSSIRLIAGVLFFVSLLLQALGFLGLGRRYASRIGYGVFAYGLAAGTLWLVSFAIGTLAFMTLITFVELLIILVASILVFVFFIVEGAALITVRDLTLMRGASVASGILFVIAGALLCSLFLSPVGFVVLVPANVIGGILFLRGFRRLPGHMIFSLQGNAPLL